MGAGWLQAIAGVAGTGMGLALEKHNDTRQLGMERKLQRQQMEGEKEMTDYNFQKQLQMWKDTNFSAQMNEMSKAGINPALIYGTSGGGATTTGGGGASLSRGEAPKGGQEVIQGMGLAMQSMQLQLLNAQKQNIEADTRNKQADTGVKGATIPKLGAETQSLLQGIENQKSIQQLTKIQTNLAELEQQFQSDTLQNRESIINITLSKLIEETKILENDRQISDATKNDKIKIIGNTVKNIAADTLNKAANTAKSNAEKEKIQQEIKNLEQQWDINSIDQEMAKDGANPKAGNLLRLFHNLLRFIGQTIGR